MGTRCAASLPPIGKNKCLINRPLDFVYDPVYTVSDAKEYYKNAYESLQCSSEYAVRPNYSSMFSDVSHYPRVTYLLKTANVLPDCIDPSFENKKRAMKSSAGKAADVTGADRFKYFKKGPLLSVPPKIGIDDSSPSLRSMNYNMDFGNYFSKVIHESRFTQTDYRDSETQTVPWEPPYIVSGIMTPEILTLTCLSWEQGLPAGVHEVEIIERARMKRAWEKLLPVLDTPEIKEKKYKCLADIERDEWRFRDEEIQAIHSLRMELANKILHQKRILYKEKLIDRVIYITSKKEAETEEKVKIVKQWKDRELRKLHVQHRGNKMKVKKQSALAEITDPTSQLHGPMLRYGGLTKNRHEEINYDTTVYQDITGLSRLEKLQVKSKGAFDYERLAKPKTYYEMCPRIMRFSEENMKKLQEDIQKMHNLENDIMVKPTCIQRVPHRKPEPPAKHLSDYEKTDTLFTSASFLQKVLRGRAVQCMIVKQRHKYRAQIEEHRSIHALDEHNKKRLTKLRYKILNENRKNLIHKIVRSKKDEVILLLKGEMSSDILDFLAKEQERLEDEQRVQAFAMLAERERWKREAAESGRRQREDEFRQKLDEAFKQVMKVRQETIGKYLEDVIIGTMKDVAEDNARQYVRKVAKQVDLAAKEADQRSDILEQEEMVTHLLHNFLVPETHKEIVRRRLEAKQRKYLEVINEIANNKLLQDPFSDTFLNFQQEITDNLKRFKKDKIKIFEDVIEESYEEEEEEEEEQEEEEEKVEENIEGEEEEETEDAEEERKEMNNVDFVLHGSSSIEAETKPSISNKKPIEKISLPPLVKEVADKSIEFTENLIQEATLLAEIPLRVIEDIADFAAVKVECKRQNELDCSQDENKL